MTKFKVGDQVEFKQDIEGHGTILEILKQKTFMGYSYTYVVGHEDHSYEPWHITARDHAKFGSVVYLSEREIFED